MIDIQRVKFFYKNVSYSIIDKSEQKCCTYLLNDTICTVQTILRTDNFYIHGSVHRNSILRVRSNKMQQYAGVYLLQNYSTCFGCQSHPSSGLHKTLTAASGTDHSIWTTTFLQHGLISPSWRKVVVQILLPVPEAAVTVVCSPDDGCDGHLKHVESDFAVNKYLHTVASCWILLIYVPTSVGPEERKILFSFRGILPAFVVSVQERLHL